MRDAFVVFAILLGVAVLTFFITAGLVWVACWAFSWVFTWKLVIGIYIIELLLSVRIRIG